MHDLPTDWAALCAVVLLLGLRHGFDADHMAAIDGLTRIASRAQRRHARYCGALFSLGHGSIVLAIAAAVAMASERWSPPAWLDSFGAWVSIAFLLCIAMANLRAVMRTAPGCVVTMVGLKGSWLSRALPARTPLGVAAAGSLFALSFDTVSQAALFAVTAAAFGGVSHAVLLGLLFVLGMLASDGLCGWWISRLIARADSMAALASRIMSVAVSTVSLLVAALGVGRLLSTTIEGFSGGKELWFGAIVVVVVTLSYLVARACARASARASAGQVVPARTAA